ncbi:MAG: TIGR03905 family TSCPD domain-containing protein [Tannerellaceae bacterium]|jgi:uncharacterized protein (TIGR03905 family)|nr:TIGR03905 family TSCPD domain-containing protein [Tannerellaceae bacterium]
MSKKQYTYIPDKKVCSNQITIETEGDTICRVEVAGGCHGNSQGVASLLKGMRIDEAIKRLEGIVCGKKGTSCPDQIAQALKELTR